MVRIDPGAFLTADTMWGFGYQALLCKSHGSLGNLFTTVKDHEDIGLSVHAGLYPSGSTIFTLSS